MDYVTANFLANHMDTGNKQTINIPAHILQKAAANAASININDITPAFTAFPILSPTGFLIALINGVNIIHTNGNKNSVATNCK